MPDNLSFTQRGWDEYVGWQLEDKRTIKKINALIKDVLREPFLGIGHPEPLKENLSGYWSREIDEKNRLIYRVQGGGVIEIIQCRGHYSDK